MHFKTRKNFVSINDADLWPFTSRLSNTLVSTSRLDVNIQGAKTRRETNSFVHSFIYLMLIRWDVMRTHHYSVNEKGKKKPIQRQKVFFFCVNARLLAMLLLILYKKYIYLYIHSIWNKTTEDMNSYWILLLLRMDICWVGYHARTNIKYIKIFPETCEKKMMELLECLKLWLAWFIRMENLWKLWSFKNNTLRRARK